MLYDGLEDLFRETGLGRVHYKRRRGSGTEVLFLHGLAASTQTWARLIERLPASLGVCLIDLLGHGKSDAPEMDYTVAAQARMVTEFIGLEGLGDCYLFGHSYGGQVAASMAQGKFKGRGMMLEEPAGLKDQYDDLARDGRLEKVIEEEAREARILNLDERVAKSILGNGPKECLTGESLGLVSTPTLLLWGGMDKGVPIKYGSLFNKYIRGSRLEVIEGAGHVPHYTHPDEVAKAILEFTRN